MQKSAYPGLIPFLFLLGPQPVFCSAESEVKSFENLPNVMLSMQGGKPTTFEIARPFGPNGESNPVSCDQVTGVYSVVTQQSLHFPFGSSDASKLKVSGPVCAQTGRSCTCKCSEGSQALTLALTSKVSAHGSLRDATLMACISAHKPATHSP